MTSVFVDPNRIHTKKILIINGPLKQFNTKAGMREKFELMFEDGYSCEYCPLVGDGIPIPAPGSAITFRIKHRGEKGDEIELAANPPQQSQGYYQNPQQHQQSRQPQQQSSAPPGKIFTLSGHPASLALGYALRLAEVNKGEKKHDHEEFPMPVMTSDIISDAEAFYTWMLQKANE